MLRHVRLCLGCRCRQPGMPATFVPSQHRHLASGTESQERANDLNSRSFANVLRHSPLIQLGDLQVSWIHAKLIK